MELIPHRLTPKHHFMAFVVWLGLVGSRPLAHPVPYLPQTVVEAVPKYISGRTSYLRVRLAFHLYPQLIPAFCTRHGFGPPLRYYRGFNLAMGSSPGFGSNPDNTLGIMETRPPASAPDAASARRIELPLCPLHPPSAPSPPGSRPVRTRFRCGSRTDVP